MTEIISRLFGSREAADAAVESLIDFGFFPSGIFVVSPPASPPSDDAGRAAALEAIANEAMKGWVLKYRAKIYAEEILAGATLVTVHAYFGFGKAANVLLDEAGPIASKVADAPRAYIPYDEAAPLSSALQLPVLSDPHSSFSRFFSMAILASSKFHLTGALGLPLLADSKAPKTSFGLPLLSKSATPLSSLLKLPTLS